MCISFPYSNIDQVPSTVSVIPYITQYDDGRLSTSFSTVTLEEDPECDFFDEDQFTWVTHGRTLYVYVERESIQTELILQHVADDLWNSGRIRWPSREHVRAHEDLLR